MSSFLQIAPLIAVIGLLEMALEDSQHGHSDRQALEAAHGSALGLLDLIGDVLDISRIESGHMTLQPVACDLVALIHSTLRVFEGSANLKGLVMTALLPDSPTWLLVDPLRFKQVLSNLVSNAIKFTDQGHIEVSLTIAPVDGGMFEITLQIKDSGVGISSIDQARLFTSFSQVDGRQARQGAGLGLVISRELCELMGGELNMNSIEGLGTQVAVHLTLPGAAPPGTETTGNALIEPGAGPLQVLIVDDYPANLLLLDKQLRSLGHQVTLAEQGKAALSLWQDGRFDVVITDCSMPVMDGHELTRQIRAREREANLPAVRIIGVTANAQAEERQRCLDNGMDECLFKPIGLQALKACLPLATEAPRASGFDLAQLRHLTQDDDRLVKRLLEQLAQSSAEDLQALHALGDNPSGAALAPVVHRVKGGARMLKVKGVRQDCEALEQAIAQGQPVEKGLAQLRASLHTLELELRQSLSAIEGSN